MRQVQVKNNHKVCRQFTKFGLLAGILLLSVVPVVANAVSVHSHAPSCNFLPASLCKNDFDSIMSGFANWLVGIIGALAVIMIVVSGIQMASAGDSPDRLKAAKSRLMNAIIALALLVSMRAILALLGISI